MNEKCNPDQSADTQLPRGTTDEMTEGEGETCAEGSIEVESTLRENENVKDEVDITVEPVNDADEIESRPPTPTQKLTILDIPIEDVKQPEDGRIIGDITQFICSIQKVGLLQPINVDPANVVLDGQHRLLACKALGWPTIPAIVGTLDTLEARLVTIDANLCRNELNVLERCEQLVERKNIYELIHRDATAQARRTAGMNRKGRSELTNAASPTFVEDVAKLTKSHKRTIQQSLQIGSDLFPEVRDRLRNSKFASRKTTLLNLSRQKDRGLQMEEAESLLNGEKSKKTQGSRTSALLNELDTKVSQIEQRLTDHFFEERSMGSNDVDESKSVSGVAMSKCIQNLELRNETMFEVLKAAIDRLDAMQIRHSEYDSILERLESKIDSQAQSIRSIERGDDYFD